MRSAYYAPLHDQGLLAILAMGDMTHFRFAQSHTRIPAPLDFPWVTVFI
jgi:hypothetical protein